MLKGGNFDFDRSGKEQVVYKNTAKKNKNRNSKALKELILHGIGMSTCDDGNWGYLEVRQTVKKICNTLIDYLLLNEDSPEADQQKAFEGKKGNRQEFLAYVESL